MLLSMRSHDVVGVEGILNATSNLILTLMEDEMVELEGAIARAQALGVAEANVELDIGGLDAAAKLVIISNVVGKPIRLDGVRRVSLASVKLRGVMLALKEGYTLKYIARANFKERRASVEPMKIPRADILSQVRGTMNAAKIRSDVGD
jgi:homoserine dehydrogenase